MTKITESEVTKAINKFYKDLDSYVPHKFRVECEETIKSVDEALDVMDYEDILNCYILYIQEIQPDEPLTYTDILPIIEEFYDQYPKRIDELEIYF